MSLLLVLLLVGVGAWGAVVVLTGDPGRQAVGLAVSGLLFTVLFVLLLAPDVALSQLAVGSAVVPLMVLLAARTIARGRHQPGPGDAARDAPGDGEDHA